MVLHAVLFILSLSYSNLTQVAAADMASNSKKFLKGDTIYMKNSVPAKPGRPDSAKTSKHVISEEADQCRNTYTAKSPASGKTRKGCNSHATSNVIDSVPTWICSSETTRISKDGLAMELPIRCKRTHILSHFPCKKNKRDGTAGKPAQCKTSKRPKKCQVDRPCPSACIKRVVKGTNKGGMVRKQSNGNGMECGGAVGKLSKRRKRQKKRYHSVTRKCTLCGGHDSSGSNHDSDACIGAVARKDSSVCNTRVHVSRKARGNAPKSSQVRLDVLRTMKVLVKTGTISSSVDVTNNTEACHTDEHSTWHTVNDKAQQNVSGKSGQSDVPQQQGQTVSDRCGFCGNVGCCVGSQVAQLVEDVQKLQASLNKLRDSAAAQVCRASVWTRYM